jgi:uncharacterized protein YutE (UPF0331/DUF86 family)
MIGALTEGAARDRLADIGKDIPEVRLIVLFGSVALGRSRADSDVDVAVLSDGAANLDALYIALAPRLQSSRLDLVDLRCAGAILAFQVAVDAALDINAHLIAELGATVPDDYYGGFLALAKLRVLPDPLARDLAPSAGLRNRLVHEYETLDDAKVLAAIGTAETLYAEFVKAIEAYLRQSGL